MHMPLDTKDRSLTESVRNIGRGTWISMGIADTSVIIAVTVMMRNNAYADTPSCSDDNFRKLTRKGSTQKKNNRLKGDKTSQRVARFAQYQTKPTKNVNITNVASNTVPH